MNQNTGNRHMHASRPASTLNVIAGIWLVISSWVLGFAGQPMAMWDTFLVGIAVLVLAALRLRASRAAELSWVNFVLGLWLIISPFALGFSSLATAMGNALIVGVLVALFGIWAASQARIAAPR